MKNDQKKLFWLRLCHKIQEIWIRNLLVDLIGRMLSASRMLVWCSLEKDKQMKCLLWSVFLKISQYRPPRSATECFRCLILLA